MNWRFLLIILMVLTTTPAANAKILVRSGEHAEFSRLVFVYDEEITWSLNDHDAGYQLVLDGLLSEINLAPIYRFIPKDRLTAISVSETDFRTLLLSIAPDHHIEVFEISAGTLVVDIKYGPNPKTNVQKPLIKSGDFETTGSLPLIPDVSPAPAIGFPGLQTIEAQQKLEAQIDLAARQGLIRAPVHAAENPIETPSKKQDPAEQSLPYDPIIPDFDTYSTKEVYQNHLNLNVQNVFDRDLPDIVGASILEADHQMCLQDDLFELENWRSRPANSDEISGLRRTLIGEFDLPDKAVLEKLIKLYIVLGFGTEARDLLNAYPNMVSQNALLGELALLVETGDLTENSQLALQAHCPGKSAMWAILARPAIPLGETPDGMAIARHFSVLPGLLRKQIGPRLGTRLLKAGFTDQASGIAKLMARSAGPDNAAVSLFFAKLDLAQAHTARAEEQLLLLISTNAPNAAEAFEVLISHRLSIGALVERPLIDHAAALAHELRGSLSGQILRRVEILSWAARNEQTRAFEILTHEAVLSNLDPRFANEIANEVFLSFGRDFSDADEIVQAYFRFRYLLTGDPEMDNARRQVARSLLSVGLPKPALEVLHPMQSRSTSADAQLMGEILLQLGQAKAARKLLEQSSNSKSDALLAKTYEQLGEFDLALDTLGETTGNSDDLAWKAGRWDVVSTSHYETRRNAATYIKRRAVNGGKANADVQTMSALSEMLKRSISARATLDALMKDHPEP